jgi:hypothetical protein
MTTKVWGWIPNVNGRLSYSLIGTTDHPGPSERKDYGEYLTVQQNRNSSDAIWRPLILRGTVRCYLLLKKDQGDKLTGYAAVVPRSGMIADDFHRWFSTLISRQETDSAWLNFVVHLDKRIDSSSLFIGRSVRAFAITIERDGLVELCPKGDWQKKECAPGELTVAQSAQQAFNFVKEISHSHQHHSSSSDQLTRAHSGGLCDAIQEIQKDLMRASLLQRRQGSRRSLGVSAGILSYAKAFREVAKNRCAGNSAAFLPDPGAIDRLERSIAVRLEQHDVAHKNTWGALAVWVALLAGVLACSAATMSLYVDKQKEEYFPQLHWLAEWVTRRIFFTSKTPLESFGSTIVWTLFLFALLLCFPWCRERTRTTLRFLRMIATRFGTTSKKLWWVGPVGLVIVSSTVILTAFIWMLVHGLAR